MKRHAAEWVRANLDAVTQQAVTDLILQHVNTSGEIDQVVETREEYRHYQYHFDFRILILGKRILRRDGSTRRENGTDGYYCEHSRRVKTTMPEHMATADQRFPQVCRMRQDRSSARGY